MSVVPFSNKDTNQLAPASSKAVTNFILNTQAMATGAYYIKNTENAVQKYSNEVEYMFSQLYSRDIIEAIHKNQIVLKYFDEKKTEAAVYAALKRVFALASNYDQFLQEKTLHHTRLNTQLMIIKNRLINNMPTIVRNLKNNTVSDFFHFKTELATCQALLAESRNSTNSLLKKDFKYTNEDKANLGKLFRSDAIDIRLDEDKRTLSDLLTSIKTKDAELTAIQQEKLKLECDSLFYKNKKLFIDETIASNNGAIESHKFNIDELNEAKNETASSKREILSECYNPKSLTDFLESSRLRREQFDNEFAKSLLDTQQAYDTIADDIKELKSVNKKYHLIFMLDKSGSMDTHFKSVIKSVDEVIRHRRSLPIVNDMISVIKFDSKATIEHLNVSIKDTISISEEVGGGTSFVAPLEKLDEILEEINLELFIPIVFFLSDGDGERKQTVVSKCEEIKKRFSGTMDMLFFSVGYGHEANAECLEAMAKVFNNGRALLKVGEEMCRMYVNVTSEEELKRAFTLYEKLFSYQKSLIESKKDFVKGLMSEKSAAFNKNKELLDDLDKKTKDYMNAQKQMALDETSSMDTISKAYEASIANLEAMVTSLREANRDLLEEKRVCDQEIGKIEPLLAEKQGDEARLIGLLTALRDKHKKLQDEVHAKIEKNIETLITIRNSKDYINDLKAVGATVDESNEAKIAELDFYFKNLSTNYYKSDSLKDLVTKSAMIDDEYEIIISKLTDLDGRIQELSTIARNENIKSVIWQEVLAHFRSYLDPDDNDFVKLEKILSLRMKDNFQDEDDVQAFKIMAKLGSPAEIFQKLESVKDYTESFIDDELDQVKSAIKQLKKELKLADGNARREEKIEARIDAQEDYKDSIVEHKRPIRLILNTMDQIRLEVKEIYLQRTIKNTLMSLFYEIMDNYFPSVDILRDKYQLALKNNNN